MSISNARPSDHLANERTFLAWIRTALGLIGLGFVLARMGLFLGQIAIEETARNHLATNPRVHAAHEFVVSGIVFLVLGLIFGAWAGISYHLTRVAIDSETYKPARWSVILLTLVIIAGGLTIVGLVLWRTAEVAG